MRFFAETVVDGRTNYLVFYSDTVTALWHRTDVFAQFLATVDPDFLFMDDKAGIHWIRNG